MSINKEHIKNTFDLLTVDTSIIDTVTDSDNLNQLYTKFLERRSEIIEAFRGIKLEILDNMGYILAYSARYHYLEELAVILKDSLSKLTRILESNKLLATLITNLKTDYEETLKEIEDFLGDNSNKYTVSGDSITDYSGELFSLNKRSKRAISNMNTGSSLVNSEFIYASVVYDESSTVKKDNNEEITVSIPMSKINNVRCIPSTEEVKLFLITSDKPVYYGIYRVGSGLYGMKVEFKNNSGVLGSVVGAFNAGLIYKRFTDDSIDNGAEMNITLGYEVELSSLTSDKNYKYDSDALISGYVFENKYYNIYKSDDTVKYKSDLIMETEGLQDNGMIIKFTDMDTTVSPLNKEKIASNVEIAFIDNDIENINMKFSKINEGAHIFTGEISRDTFTIPLELSISYGNTPNGTNGTNIFDISISEKTSQSVTVSSPNIEEHIAAYHMLSKIITNRFTKQGLMSTVLIDEALLVEGYADGVLLESIKGMKDNPSTVDTIEDSINAMIDKNYNDIRNINENIYKYIYTAYDGVKAFANAVDIPTTISLVGDDKLVILLQATEKYLICSDDELLDLASSNYYISVSSDIEPIITEVYEELDNRLVDHITGREYLGAYSILDDSQELGSNLRATLNMFTAMFNDPNTRSRNVISFGIEKHSFDEWFNEVYVELKLSVYDLAVLYITKVMLVNLSSRHTVDDERFRSFILLILESYHNVNLNAKVPVTSQMLRSLYSSKTSVYNRFFLKITNDVNKDKISPLMKKYSNDIYSLNRYNVLDMVNFESGNLINKSMLFKIICILIDSGDKVNDIYNTLRNGSIRDLIVKFYINKAITYLNELEAEENTGFKGVSIVAEEDVEAMGDAIYNYISVYKKLYETDHDSDDFFNIDNEIAKEHLMKG